MLIINLFMFLFKWPILIWNVDSNFFFVIETGVQKTI